MKIDVRDIKKENLLHILP